MSGLHGVAPAGGWPKVRGRETPPPTATAAGHYASVVLVCKRCGAELLEVGRNVPPISDGAPEPWVRYRRSGLVVGWQGNTVTLACVGCDRRDIRRNIPRIVAKHLAHRDTPAHAFARLPV